MKYHYRLRSILAATALCALYLSLGRVYGYGCAIACMFCVVLLLMGLLFFVSAWFCHREENTRNAVACVLIGSLILFGTAIIALLVFQPNS